MATEKLVGERAQYKNKGDMANHMTLFEVLDENGRPSAELTAEYKEKMLKMTGEEFDTFIYGTDRQPIVKIHATVKAKNQEAAELKTKVSALEIRNAELEKALAKFNKKGK